MSVGRQSIVNLMQVTRNFYLIKKLILYKLNLILYKLNFYRYQERNQTFIQQHNTHSFEAHIKHSPILTILWAKIYILTNFKE